jgi:hypothetical protein
MVGIVARLLLAGILVAAALTKAAGGRNSRAGLATFGVDSARAQAAVSGLLIATELVLAAGVAAGSDAFAWAAALFALGLSGAMTSAIARGRGGAPCSCFGARSTVGWPAVARNLALAAAFAALPFLPADEPTTEGWLAIGLAVALLACAGLALAVLALAREIGVLRLRLGPGAALEIADEGPELGSRSPAVERFARDSRTTTGSCPHPTPRQPRIDGAGFPLAVDGTPIDNLGRRVNGSGEPIDARGDVLRDPDGRPAAAGAALEGL